MRRFTIAAAILASTMLAGTAQAAITVYTSQSAFNAAVTAAGTDTFNNIVSGVEYTSPLARTAGSYAYTATVLRDATSTANQTFYGAGSTSDAWLSTNLTSDIMRFGGWSSAVSAVGGLFFGSDVSGNFAAIPTGVTVTATDASGTVSQVILNPTTTSFLGFVSTGGLSQVTVRTNLDATSIWPTVNNLTLAQAATAVPEPATWAMMIAGIGMIGFAMRRRGQVKTSVRFA